MIEVQNLTKRYGRKTAVDGVSFKVEKGEILGFLGPNGAGKTTTMRVLTCYLPPTEGTAKVAGYDVFEQPLEVKRRVGYCPETPPLYPDMEVAEYLHFCAKIKGVAPKGRAAKVDDAMGKTRVGDVRTTLIGKLSKGYRQRVGLAAAILHNPDVLILDEPTAGLDPKQIIETRELIKGLGGDHTIVLSTHILPEVGMTCGRVVIINKGRVVAEDTPENLTHRLRGAGGLPPGSARRGPGPRRRGARGLRGGPAAACARRRTASPSWRRKPRPAATCAPSSAAAVVQKGYGLLGLAPVGMSLEEIFLHLTTTDTAEARAPAAAAAAPRARRRPHELPQHRRPRREGVAPLLRQPHRLGGPLRVDRPLRVLLQLRLQLLPAVLDADRPAGHGDGGRGHQDVARRDAHPPRAAEHGGGGPLHPAHAHHAPARGGEAAGHDRAPRPPRPSPTGRSCSGSSWAPSASTRS